MNVAIPPRYHAGSSPFNHLLGNPQTDPYMLPCAPSWGQRFVAWVRPGSDDGLSVRRYAQARADVIQARNEWSIRNRALTKVLCGPNDRWIRDNLQDPHDRQLASEFRSKLAARSGAQGTFRCESLPNDAWRKGAAALMKAADLECARAATLLARSKSDERIPQRDLERVKRAVLVERQGAWLIALAQLSRVDGKQAEPTWTAVEKQKRDFEYQVRDRDNELRALAPRPGWSLCGGTEREQLLTKADLLAARDRVVDFRPVRVVVRKPAAVPPPAAPRVTPPPAPRGSPPTVPSAASRVPPRALAPQPNP